MKTPQTFDEPPLATADHRKTQSPRDLFARDRKRPIALIAVVALVAALIGGGSVYAWQRIDARDRTSALENAISQRDAAQDQVASLTDRLDGLQARLADVRADASAFEAQLSKARAELRAMLGPALPDGKHFGALIAVGDDQDPPRLVIDIEQWYTDQAAFDAAEEDGVFLDYHPYYIRNENPRWRTIEIDPAARARVYLQTHTALVERIVSLSRFAELFSRHDGVPESSPYWITMEDGKVVAIEEQFIS